MITTMSSARPKFIYSTIEDHTAATALLKLRYGVQEPRQQQQQQSIAWCRTMRTAAIDARLKIHDQASTR